MSLYVCKQHGTGESFVGPGSMESIRAAGCVVCRQEKLKQLLRDCSEKLALYRSQHSGVYVGGVEYGELQRRIEEATQ